MKIAYVLIVSISILFLAYALHSYSTFDLTIKQATKSALLLNQVRASALVRDIDKNVDEKVLLIHDLTLVKDFQTPLGASNTKFAKIIQENVTTSNQINKADAIIDKINYYRNNVEFSDYLIDFTYTEMSDRNFHPVQVIITNKYGINIASNIGFLGITYDDQEWWRVIKNGQVYFGKPHYSDSQQGYVVEMVFPILGPSNNFAGSMWTLVKLDDLLHQFVTKSEILQESQRNILLLNDDGDAFFRNSNFILKPESVKYHDKLSGDRGNFDFSSENKQIVSYAASTGYKNFAGSGWTVVIEQDKSSIFGEFVELEKTILYSLVIGVMSSIALGLILAFFVTNPLRQLSKTITILGEGNFQTKLRKSKLSEINSIIFSFNNMQESLKKLFETEKKLAEAHAKIKNERLSAIGELASTMAHDMKNPLTTIQSGIDIIKRDSSIRTVEIDHVVQRMERAIYRMTHQIEDVLTFVRITPLDIKQVSVIYLIKSATQSIEFPKNIVVSIEGNDALINCDPRKLEIVLINLILNALQAIGDNNGKITIRIISQEKETLIEIEDTGIGISDEIKPEIFTPLFTTKQQGTGLGLSSCKNIVEQHGGTLRFRNDPTVFTIRLPRDYKQENTKNDEKRI